MVDEASVVVETAAHGSKHLQFVLTQLFGPSARKELREAISAEQEAEIRLLVSALGRPLAVDAQVEDLLLVTSRLFLAASSLAAHYRALAAGGDNNVESVEAHVAIALRENAAASGAKVTDKSIEASVDADDAVAYAKLEQLAASELADITYGLREAVKMRYDALRQASDNRRAVMKMEG